MVLSEHNVQVKVSTLKGLSPTQFYKILGFGVKRDILPDTPIYAEDIDPVITIID